MLEYDVAFCEAVTFEQVRHAFGIHEIPLEENCADTTHCPLEGSMKGYSGNRSNGSSTSPKQVFANRMTARTH